MISKGKARDNVSAIVVEINWKLREITPLENLKEQGDGDGNTSSIFDSSDNNRI